MGPEKQYLRSLGGAEEARLGGGFAGAPKRFSEQRGPTCSQHSGPSVQGALLVTSSHTAPQVRFNRQILVCYRGAMVKNLAGLVVEYAEAVPLALAVQLALAVSLGLWTA